MFMGTATAARSKPHQIDQSVQVEDQKQLYRWLLKTRTFDERCRKLFKQGRFPGTYFSAVGQEAASVGSAYGLTKDDIIAPSHRELGAYITKGLPLTVFLKQVFARADSPDKGKSHPCHYGSPELGLFTPASTMGAQVVVGTGMALALKMRQEPHIVMSFIGEGGTSRGGFHEALNFAGVHDLPIVYVCQNNLWAESVPVSLQSGVEHFADRAKAYGFAGVTIDGNDVLLVHKTVSQAVRQARDGGGPTLVECLTYRWYGHSEIDPADYRSAKEVEEWKRRDPLARYEEYLESSGVLPDAERARMLKAIEAEIDEAIATAEASPHPEAEEALDDVYSFSPRVSFPSAEAPKPSGPMKQVTFIEAITETMAEEMRRDERVFIMGQDVGLYGGVFKATKGLQKEFGVYRVLDTPISEEFITGGAVGAAAVGMRPIAEIQFSDFVTCGFDPIIQQASRLRYRSGGGWTCPMVIRICCGGEVGGGLYHSQTNENWFFGTPGLVVVAPSTPYDAKGLLKASIRGEDPVIFLEHKRLYRWIKGEVPTVDYTLPLGRADIKRPGSQLTIVAYQLMLHRALETAEVLAKEGIDIEVIDLRTLLPWDKEMVLESARKTGKILVVHESPHTGGVAGEIAATIMEEAFDHLDAPVMRLCGLDVPPMPFAPAMEAYYMPNADKIAAKARELAAY